MRTAAKGFAFAVGVTTLSGAGYGLYKLGESQAKPEKEVVVKTVETQTTGLQAVPSAKEVEAFEQFQKDFGRQYSSESEKLAKFEIFVANLRLIEEHNAKDSGVTLAVNDFADVK